jgi:hypothetical protein
MSQPSTLRSVNGANAIVVKDGQVMGYATGVTVNEVYAVQRIDVLGEIDSRDIEPIGRVVNVSISFIRMINATTSSADQGVGAAGVERAGGAVAKGLIPTTSESVSNRDLTKSVTDFYQTGFDLIIRDSASFADAAGSDVQPKDRYKIVGCRPTSQSFAITRGTLMGINVTCEALRLVEMDA